MRAPGHMKNDSAIPVPDLLCVSALALRLRDEREGGQGGGETPWELKLS